MPKAKKSTPMHNKNPSPAIPSRLQRGGTPSRTAVPKIPRPHRNKERTVEDQPNEEELISDADVSTMATAVRVAKVRAAKSNISVVSNMVVLYLLGIRILEISGWCIIDLIPFFKQSIQFDFWLISASGVRTGAI